MSVQAYYAELSRLNKRDRDMSKYEQGRQDCQHGIPHTDKSDAYTKGYSHQYSQEQCNAAQ